MCLYYAKANEAQHSDRPYPMLMNMPGLKIVIPTTPADVKGLLKSAIRDDDPVLCFEDATLWADKGPVSDDPEHLIPLGKAAIRRQGSDVTVVAVGGSVKFALAAAETAARQGVSVEVVDPRSLVPLDVETILDSVDKTGRVVVVDPAHLTCSAASEIAATIAEQGFWRLRAPIARVATPDIHIPFSPVMEKPLYPNEARILAAIQACFE
jgi:pyruvate dehydrogenase E1 component beta subunit